MKKSIKAIYENGVLEPLNLPDHVRVSIAVESAHDEEWIDHDAMKWAKREGDPTKSLAEVRRRLAKITRSLSDVVIAERGDY